ncbi:MAG: ABC transporter ATP-binding protein, partial [Nitrososphaeria archaeon]
QPDQLLKRKLARVNARENHLEKMLDMLKNGAGESEITAFAVSNGISGIEEQVINVWRRNDMSEANKEKIILSLHSEKLRFFDKIFVFSNKSKSKALTEIPGFKRMYKNMLIKEGYRKAVELLSLLEIPSPDKVVKMYPHELSGGMRQRIMIAIALANNPELVIMDEPTSALDVTVQAQILELIKILKGRFNTSFIIISHDLSVLAEVCDRIGIMYAGRIVEISSKEDVFKKPLHPYTQMLISAIPTIETHDLKGIGGSVPDMRNPPSGCMFNPRCPYVMDVCKTKEPKMIDKDGHQVSCFLYGENS